MMLARCITARTTEETNLVEWVRLDLGEFMLHVIGVHGLDLITRRRSEHLDDFHQLINSTLPRKEGLSQHQFCHDTSCGPDI